MTFARPIMALLAASAASAAAFAPAAPLASAARPAQSAAKASPTLLRAPRAMPAQRRASPGGNGMAMAWGSEGYLIAPSIVNADLACLGREVDDLLAAGADVVHMDVGDGHFGKDLSLGPMVCKALRAHGVTAPIDVHLKTLLVDRRIADFITAGADSISFHPEASENPGASLDLIRASGVGAGLALNVETPLEAPPYQFKNNYFAEM